MLFVLFNTFVSTIFKFYAYFYTCLVYFLSDIDLEERPLKVLNDL